MMKTSQDVAANTDAVENVATHHVATHHVATHHVTTHHVTTHHVATHLNPPEMDVHANKIQDQLRRPVKKTGSTKPHNLTIDEIDK